MTDFSSWIADLDAAWRNIIGAIISYLPNIAGVVLLLLIGWILARWVRTAVFKLGDVVNRIMQKFLEGTSFSRFQLATRSLQIAGNAAFWFVLLVFFTAAAKAAKLDAFSNWLDRILAYFPVLLSGGLIIAAGYFVSMFTRDIVSAALASSGFRQSVLLGRVAQGAVFLVSVVIGIDQVGLDVSFLITLIAITLASLFGGVALAFGIGSRDFVANIIAAQNLQQHYKPGQTVRFGSASGEILEITPTSVVVATEEGRTTIPASNFHQHTSVLVTPGDTSE